MTPTTADGRPPSAGGARPTETDGADMSPMGRHPDPGVLASRRQLPEVLLAVVLALTAAGLVLLGRDGGRDLDPLGWTLLVTAHLPMVWRRAAPVRAFLALVVVLVPYHALDYHHSALMAVSMVALYTVAATQPALRSLGAGAGVMGLVLTVKFAQGLPEGAEALQVSGWIVAFLALGACVRYHRQNIAAAVERADRAERSREEEVRRRVAEERLRIARDLHDLLAHSITLVGVRASVAAHVLEADPERLDRAALARALEDIAETCRTARGELRTTLGVLRHGPEHGRDPLPGLSALPGLVDATRASGAEVSLDAPVTREVPPAVGAAAYRIVQEALTNAVRHGGPRPVIRVSAHEAKRALRVEVTNRSARPLPPSPHPPGFGLVGLREQARSVGGTLSAEAETERVFAVRALLPLAGTVDTAGPTDTPLTRPAPLPAGRATTTAVPAGATGTERGTR